MIMRNKWLALGSALLLLAGAAVAILVARGRTDGEPKGTAPEVELDQPDEPGAPAGPGGVWFGLRHPDGGAVTPALVITATESWIAGIAQHGERVEAVLHGPDGSVRGAGNGPAADGGAGVWSARLTDDAGEPAVPRAGDTLRATARGLDLTARVPEVGVSIERGAAALSGAAPGSRLVAVQPATAGADWYPVVPAPDGRFEIGLPAGALAHRKALTLTVLTEDDLLLVLRRQVPYVRASLHPGNIIGNLTPEATVEVALSTESGQPRADARAVAVPANGSFNVWLRDDRGRLIRPEPGDRLTVDDGGSRIEILLPDLVQAADIDRQVVLGTALPDTSMGVFLWHPWRPGEVVDEHTPVGPDGRWELDPGVWVGPGSHYYLTLEMPSGDEVTHCLQLPRLHVEPGSPRVLVEALWDVEGAVTLMRDGRELAGAVGGGVWSRDLDLILRDAAGEPVAAMPGDEIRAELNGFATGLTVGPLEAEIDPVTGAVVGRAPAGAEVGLAHLTLLSDVVATGPGGAFQLDPEERAAPGASAAAPGRRFAAFYETEEGHVMRRVFAGPAVGVEIGSREVEGSAQPGARLIVTRSDARGSTLGPAISAAADETGEFAAEIDPSSSPIAPGDVIELSDGSVTATLRVPELSMTVDRSTGILQGRAPGWSLLTLHLFPGDALEPEERHVTVSEDGAWSLDLLLDDQGRAAVDPASLTRVELVWLQEPEDAIVEVHDQVRLVWRSERAAP